MNIHTDTTHSLKMFDNYQTRMNNGRLEAINLDNNLSQWFYPTGKLLKQIEDAKRNNQRHANRSVLQ